jgi:20S proteasome subunit beta 2
LTNSIDRLVKETTNTIHIMPGFDFSNYNRNAALHARGVPLPKATSTGTTIVGCIYDGGVVVS